MSWQHEQDGGWLLGVRLSPSPRGERAAAAGGVRVAVACLAGARARTVLERSVTNWQDAPRVEAEMRNLRDAFRGRAEDAGPVALLTRSPASVTVYEECGEARRLLALFIRAP